MMFDEQHSIIPAQAGISCKMVLCVRTDVPAFAGTPIL